MYTISKQFGFEASHHLPLLPSTHKCSRDHGHSYQVIVELRALEVDAYGFVVDYGELDAFKQYIDATLDHRDLNDVLPIHPTAENIAKYLFDWCAAIWPQVVAVTVQETGKTSARYAP